MVLFLGSFSVLVYFVVDACLLLLGFSVSGGT